MFSLQGKNAVITGAGSGIGQAIAHTFAENGAEVRILELRKEAAEETLTQIRSKGGKAKIFAGNVSNQKEMMDLMQQMIEEDGKIDILVNCAGIAHVGKLDQTTEEDFDRIYNVNVKGIYNCMYAVIGQMLKQHHGIILNMASVASSVGIVDRFAYSMSKGAVLTMTLSVAKDYIDKNIRCNCISPARVHTPFVDGFLAKNYPGKEKEMFDKLSKTQPIGRMAEPKEVAAVALFLCSDEAGFITGCDYPVDGGFIKLNN
ncbi:MAG: SDR family oxidoreductase [Chitinophagaceae bacterium]|nr:MAG: SDR family oxidoreductase [Chitinophagaceae bacterium]